MTENDWNHKDEWRKHGNKFCVVVSRHSVEKSRMFPDNSEGANRWAVYAYIYPDHPHFHNFNGDSIYQDAANALILHAGASLVRWHHDGGKVCSVQVGADYHHDGDNRHTHKDTAEDASDIFYDAQELFNQLWVMETPESVGATC